MNRLLAVWAHELPCGEVEVVVDMRQPVGGNHLRIGQGGNVDDATEARRAGEDLIRVDDQRGMCVLVDGHWQRSMRRPKAAPVEWRYVVKARDDCRVECIADVDNHEPGITPGNIEAVLVEIDLVTLNNLWCAIRIELVLRRVGLSNML